MLEPSRALVRSRVREDTRMDLPDGYMVERPSLDDADGIAAVMGACGMAAIGRPDSSPEEVRSMMTFPDHEPASDDWIIRDASGVIVAAVLSFAESPFHRLELDVYVDPQHRGLGFDTILLDLAEERLRDAVPLAPDGVQVTVDHGLFAQETEDTELLRARGYSMVRTFYRLARALDPSLQAPRVPEGIKVRDMRPGIDERAVYAVYEDAFRDHWGSPRESYDQWAAWSLEHAYAAPGLWALAWEGEELAGAVITRGRSDDDPDLAWVGDLAVRPASRGRGIGRALLLETARRAKRAGSVRIGLGVDAENPTGALDLYTSIGMDVIEEIHIYRRVLREGRELRREEG